MRTLAILTFALFGTALHCAAQKLEVFTGDLQPNQFSQVVSIPAGKVMEVSDFFTTNSRLTQANDSLDAVLETPEGDGTQQLLRARLWSASAALGGLRKLELVGPLTVRVKAPVGSRPKFYLYYRLRDNVEDAGTQTSQTVVIPEDANGDVEIILESSKDLVNWTKANPGVYNSETTDQRFFRVRAVKVGE